MPVNTPQALLHPLSQAAIFLVAKINPGGEEAVHGALAELAGLTRTIGFRDPDKQLSLVTGIGSAAWDRLFRGGRPDALHPFVELSGPRHKAPSTPGDLLFHIRAETMDYCFELASRLMVELGDAVSVVDEVHGFRYYDRRDLLGFVDGTENPIGRTAAAAALTDDGGSYVHVQKYLHNVAAWRVLPVDEQERVIGRTKFDDIELPDGVKPENAHTALNVIEDEDGDELKIVRANMPFGSVGNDEFGTYFIGYSHDPAITERMLRNMFLGDPPGNTDRILDFSTAVTGGLFFAPSADFLAEPPALPGS